MQTYGQLQQQLKFEQQMPVTPEWSAAADFLFLIKDHCLSKRPKTIVECSSGLTSLVLSRCCQVNNKGHVYSLENAEEFQQQTLKQLKQFDLLNFADVFHAPLIKHTIMQHDYDWYNPQAVRGLEIDMLVIDGPPGFIQKYSRLPALPVLFDQFTDGACIFLDDAARDEEKEIVEIWLKEYTDLCHEYIETERGCSVLKINKA